MKKYKPKRIKKVKRFELNKRESSTKRGYDAEWSKYRFRFLHHNKKCYACGQDANVVDHIIPAKVDREKYFWKEDNYLPLCAVCHNTITGLFDRHRNPNTEGKIKWLQEQREKNNVSVRVKIVPIKK
jgi:5-methylcytosine-specific restriction endonuclease McrA